MADKHQKYTAITPSDGHPLLSLRVCQMIWWSSSPRTPASLTKTTTLIGSPSREASDNWPEGRTSLRVLARGILQRGWGGLAAAACVIPVLLISIPIQ